MMEFTPYDIEWCLYDKKRVNNYRMAIQKKILHSHVVADIGAGTGILSLLAAKAGAKRIYAVEINRRAVRVLRENAKRNRSNRNSWCK